MCAACTRWFLVCCTTELRSKELSWVTAIETDCWAGGARRGRTTLTRITTHTSTARNSGSKPLSAPSLDSPYPWGGVRPERSERGRGGDVLRNSRRCHLTTRSATLSSRTPRIRKLPRSGRQHPRRHLESDHRRIKSLQRQLHPFGLHPLRLEPAADAAVHLLGQHHLAGAGLCLQPRGQVGHLAKHADIGRLGEVADDRRTDRHAGAHKPRVATNVGEEYRDHALSRCDAGRGHAFSRPFASRLYLHTQSGRGLTRDARGEERRRSLRVGSDPPQPVRGHVRLAGAKFGIGERRSDMPGIQLETTGLECVHGGAQRLTCVVEPSLVKSQPSSRGGDTW